MGRHHRPGPPAAWRADELCAGHSESGRGDNRGVSRRGFQRCVSASRSANCGCNQSRRQMTAKHHLLALLALGVSVSHLHAITLASGGRARAVIVQSAEANAAEKHAATELPFHLQAITGTEFQIETNAIEVPQQAIIVGPGVLAAK